MVLDLIQKRHISHRPALGFRVHQHAMPERKRDGRVIGMAACAPGVDAWVAGHNTPAPARGFRVVEQHGTIFRSGKTVRKSFADVDRLAACAVEAFHRVRLSTSTAKWLITQHQLRVYYHYR